MADGEEDGSTTVDSTSNLTEAEKRRLRRRQRILDNQGARLQRILSDNSGSSNQGAVSEKSEEKPDSSSPDFDEDTSDFRGTPSNYGEIFGEKSKKVTEIRTEARPTTSARSKPKSKDEDVNQTPNLASLLQELSSDPSLETSREEPVRIGVQSDGSVILPKISGRVGKILLCVLATFLSLMKAKQYFVTFVSWEVAFYFINGLPPLPPSNMFLVLAAVMGLKDAHLRRIKKLLHIVNCVINDFSLYLTFILLPHVLSTFIVT